MWDGRVSSLDSSSGDGEISDMVSYFLETRTAIQCGILKLPCIAKVRRALTDHSSCSSVQKKQCLILIGVFKRIAFRSYAFLSQ